MSHKVNSLCNQHNYRCTCCVEVVLNKWIYKLFCYYSYLMCQVLLLTSQCNAQYIQYKQAIKSAPAQYKCCYYLVPPRSLLRKQIKNKLMLCKPLLTVHCRVKGLLKVIVEYKNEAPQFKSGCGTCITRLHKHLVSSLSVQINEVLLYNKK